MGKLVLGIVVVFCLSLAFILFIRGGGDLVELAQAINLRSVDPVLIFQGLEIPEAQNTQSEDIYAAHAPKTDSISLENTFRTEIPRQIQVNKRVQIRRVRSQPLRSYALKGPAEPFTDTVIWIERASYLSESQIDRLDDLQPKPAAPPVTDFEPTKRSFFSRARHVVKKPSDWLKAFGTKLF